MELKLKLNNNKMSVEYMLNIRKEIRNVRGKSEGNRIADKPTATTIVYMKPHVFVQKNHKSV